MYRWRPGQSEIPLGLLQTKQAEILPWSLLAVDPKYYGYLTRGGKTECKVRGFTLVYPEL